MRTRLVIVLACVMLLCGCASKVKLDASTAKDESSKKSEQSNDQSGTSGRDTNQTLISLFSNLSYQGGSAGALLATTLLALAGLKWNAARKRRSSSFNVLIRAIEQSKSQEVKQAVLHDALERGMADYIHARTRKIDLKDVKCKKS